MPARLLPARLLEVVLRQVVERIERLVDAPQELGRQDPSAGFAHTHELARGSRPIDEHRHRFRDDAVESIVGVPHGGDVAWFDRDAVLQPGCANVRRRALQHERGDVDGGHLGAEATGDLDRGGPDTAAHVQHPLPGLKIGAADQLVGGGPATGVNDALTQHGEERVRVELTDLDIAERTGSSGDLCIAHCRILLEGGRTIGPGEQVGDLRGSGELRVLPLEVRFRYPTGTGAASSNVDPNASGHRLGQDLLERRPAERHQILSDDAGHQVHRLIGEDYLRLVTTLNGPVGHDEGHRRVGRICRPADTHEQ